MPLLLPPDPNYKTHTVSTRIPQNVIKFYEQKANEYHTTPAELYRKALEQGAIDLQTPHDNLRELAEWVDELFKKKRHNDRVKQACETK